jgi:hypothetical protein
MPAEPSEDVELRKLVARAIAEHPNGCDPAAPCIVCTESAERVVAVLAEAGRLREPGDVEQWAWDCGDRSLASPCVHPLDNEARARRMATANGGSVLRRRVGLWLPVEPTDTPKEPDHG